MMNDFDHIEWLREFEIAASKKAGFRELRADVFRNTIKFVKNGGYYIDSKFVEINNGDLIERTEYFVAPDKLTATGKYDTQFSVINADCLETAQLLFHAGFQPCLLNMASHQNPGGGVQNGAGAQEENLFRRTNLFMSLYQFVPYADQYGIKKSVHNYPLNRNTGGIYSSNITVFRGSEKNGYCLLKKPFNISVVTVPAINRPNLVKKNGNYYIDDSLVEPAKEKIRTILRITRKYEQNCLVLSAFGCGAFRNPPNHVAELFKNVFAEKEFKNIFKLVVFSIFEDHNSKNDHNPNGNVLPFHDVFND